MSADQPSRPTSSRSGMPMGSTVAIVVAAVAGPAAADELHTKPPRQNGPVTVTGVGGARVAINGFTDQSIANNGGPALAGLAYGGMWALVGFVEPQPREMSKQLPPNALAGK